MKDPIRVTSLTRVWKSLLRWFSPNEWIVWLLGLKRSTVEATEPGLILIQIDGLPQSQLKRALEGGRMPFLNRLIKKEQYLNHSLYSGLPSSTPAVQAELYYGKRTVVPAFGFRDHRTGKLERMFASGIAQDIEQRLEKNVEGLLSGGASYCNIYSGGAAEAHFCATSFGWSEFFKAANPIKILIVMLFNFWMFARVFGLMVVEFFSAIYGFFRGVLSGREFWQELIMIPARVIVVVLLRELATIGTCFDAARGLPVIHLNLLGFDEQAHRRGPGSRFAHWSLGGIDNAIRRIWNAAHRGAGREYDVWIFSDHGQEETTPYQNEQGILIQQVVAELVDEKTSPDATGSIRSRSRLPSRASWIGVGWLISVLFGEQDNDIQARSDSVQTVTSGPLGFVYLLTEQAKKRSAEIACRLVELNVPMVVLSENEKHAKVVTASGTFVLPDDAVTVFGADHPFLDEICTDMVSLASHTDAGDMVLVGWNHDGTSTSFVLQNGAHAGPGIEETRGFALIPSDVHLPQSDRHYLRPNDLRMAGLRLLDRDVEGHDVIKPSIKKGRIRIMTYNIHACVGMDGQLSPRRIARVIAQTNADVVCLQELDVGRHRSGFRDQVCAIAQHLSMDHQFQPAWQIEEEQFGNAILTRLPMKLVQASGLHHHKKDRSRRSALWVEIELGNGVSLQVINSHLSIYPAEQKIQAQQLLEEWVHPASLIGPVVLCGDFNARPGSKTHKILVGTIQDVESFDSFPTRPTLFSPFPLTRVDHIFVSEGLRATKNHVIQSRLAKTASDHLPLVSDLKLVINSPLSSSS